MRVLVCDDSAIMRRVIREILESEPGIEVPAVARNGEECLELARQLKPDLITLDIEMPVMNGLAALTRIMAEVPTNVIMVSSLTVEGSRESMKALRLGAVDVVAKDHSNFTSNAEALKQQILERVRALGDAQAPKAVCVRSTSRPPAIAARCAGDDQHKLPRITSPVGLTVIGSSTGGPPIVEHVLSRVPAGTKNAIVVAQHMPKVFTQSMAHHLDEVLDVPVVHLDPGVSVEPGRIHIAPGGLNTHIRTRTSGRYAVRIDREPQSTIYYPSATELFTSAAAVAGHNTLAVVLTGMGADGAQGVRAVLDAGGNAVSQDEVSSVVYGMPKAAAENGAHTATPDQIRDLIAKISASARAAA